MMNAKTPEERQALMAQRQQMLESRMDMMQTTMEMMMQRMPAPGTAPAVK